MALNAYGNMALKAYDFEPLWEEWLWRLVSLNACGRNGFEDMWLWTPVGGMALKAYGSECLWRKWLWMPKIEKYGFERLKLKEMTLNA